MARPDFTTDNFADAMAALLPGGRVWPRDLDTTIRKTLMGLSVTYFRNQQRGNYLLVDSFPATALELLPEWEASVGLPDPCAGVSPTIEARRAQVVARLSKSGGQSPGDLIAFALSLGYVITITEFAPFRVGFNRAGDPLYGQDWAYAWAVNAQLNQIHYFRVGLSAAGEPLAYWGNAVLECELKSVKPSHTVLFFKYS